MSTQFACHAREAVLQDLGRPNCPRCGSVLLIAEESEFNDKGQFATPGRAMIARTSS